MISSALEYPAGKRFVFSAIELSAIQRPFASDTPSHHRQCCRCSSHLGDPAPDQVRTRNRSRFTSQCSGTWPSQGMPESRRGAAGLRPWVTAWVMTAMRFSLSFSSSSCFRGNQRVNLPRLPVQKRGDLLLLGQQERKRESGQSLIDADGLRHRQYLVPAVRQPENTASDALRSRRSSAKPAVTSSMRLTQSTAVLPVVAQDFPLGQIDRITTLGRLSADEHIDPS